MWLLLAGQRGPTCSYHPNRMRSNSCSWLYVSDKCWRMVWHLCCSPAQGRLIVTTASQIWISMTLDSIAHIQHYRKAFKKCIAATGSCGAVAFLPALSS